MGEGRQRFDDDAAAAAADQQQQQLQQSDDLPGPLEDSGGGLLQTMQNRLEQIEQERANMKRQIEQERETMKRQIERNAAAERYPGDGRGGARSS